MSGADQPNVVELEAAITLHAQTAARYGRFWKNYDWTHEQINVLLDQREQLIAAQRRAITTRVAKLFSGLGNAAD